MSRGLAVIVGAAVLGVVGASGARGAYLIQVDIDGSSAGTAITLNPKVTYGNGQTTSSVSGASTAVGLAPGNSIFGGNGAPADQYIYAYSPGTDADNLVLAAGTELNDDGDVATGLAAGASGTYNVYATWPATINVSGDPSNYELFDNTNNTSVFSVDITQNNAGGEWVLLSTADLVAGNSYSLRQTAANSNFVSMRAAGVLFDIQPAAPVPEPAGALALGAVVPAVLARRGRRPVR